MAIIKCKMCGGALEITQGATVAECEYCGTKQTLPRLDDDRKANLYDRANHFRRNNEFDKAMGIYEQILNEDGADAEAYWSLVLCRYGIEYVEDPASHKRIPTINRAQFTSIFDDDNYKSALQYADKYQKDIYEAEAKAINEIQKRILAISEKEEPFDVFVCYKETDNSGRRTPDSVLAQELYYQLTQEGFKVFFSRITLEDKLGSAYEPYIFAALNSAKVMVVLGTKLEHFKAVWVRNEWSRYLSLIKSGAKKTLIPAYKDMDPYDLPEEFSHLQAQDMSKLGFMQDLLRGIKKIVGAEDKKTTVIRETIVSSGNTNTASLLKRAFLFLEDGDWNSADEYCEKVLDVDPECAEAYLYKLMVELKVKNLEALAGYNKPFDNSVNYQKVMRFASDTLKADLSSLMGIINTRNKEESGRRKRRTSKITVMATVAIGTGIAVAIVLNSVIAPTVSYNKAMALMYAGEYSQAIEVFETLGGHKDSAAKIIECMYNIALASMDAGEYTKAIAAFEALDGYKDSAAMLKDCKYNNAIALMDVGRNQDAIPILKTLTGYKDSDKKLARCEAILLMDQGKTAQAAIAFYKLGDADCKALSKNLWNQVAVRDTISTGEFHTVGLKAHGMVVATGDNSNGQCDVSEWRDIVAISAGDYHTVGLKADGTVVATKDRLWASNDEVSKWKDIVAISVSSLTVGLKADGTVVATENSCRCDVSEWREIVAVSAGYSHVIGLKVDGTVVATGPNLYGENDVADWKDIVAISAGGFHTVGLKADGTVVATGRRENGRCDVSEWKDIVAISAGGSYTVGVKADGTVVTAGGSEDFGQRNVSEWKYIVDVSAGKDYHTVGLKADGTVVAVGINSDGQCNISSWTDIKIPQQGK